ncbi:hypothetical protein K1T71_014163 [Dendrolimus kikuchii]|uniref:Uncharacterized protein n=1 Tax=Dendrolimus kikuchii TaxID=765133 RepID=A0ACC1CF54_9NEOP|nr:hypothetical protein K1T71_014163 [Dendrolimus kikuchii]
MEKIFLIIFVFGLTVTDIVFAQYQILQIKISPQMQNTKQNSIASFVSMLSEMSFPDKINAIAVAIQKTPSKTDGRKCQRHEMAEFLKQSALENLRKAASASNSFGGLKTEYLPPNTVKSHPILASLSRNVNDLTSNIPVKISYL